LGVCLIGKHNIMNFFFVIVVFFFWVLGVDGYVFGGGGGHLELC